MFRAVRETVLSLGYRFTRDDFCNYKTFHLAALPKILSRRMIPYFDTVSPIAEMERVRPTTFASDMALRPQSNFTMHEACHAIAHAFLPPAPRGDAHAIVLRSHLGESLANTLDTFAGAYVDSEVHRFLFNMNSYHPVRDIAHLDFLRTAMQVTSPRASFEVLYYSFLYANFLVKSVDGDNFDDLWPETSIALSMPRLTKEQRGALVRVFKCGIPALPVGFRTETAEMYFRLTHDLAGSVFELTDFDFMDHLASLPRWRAKLSAMFDALWAVVEKDSK